MSERRKAKGERRKWFAAAVLACLGAFAVACGEDDPIDIIPPPGSPTATVPASAATAEPAVPPTELRVAYINLLSPLTLDETDTAPTQTFRERLAIVIEELKVFKPDLVAFSEVTWTAELDDAAAILARELAMEPLSVRTKPWSPAVSKEKNEELVKALGFKESELILVRGAVFVPADGNQRWLNPRTSEIEGPGALWVRLKVPGQAQDVDVFLTHLTGADSAARARQAADFAQFITEKRGDGPIIVLGDLGDAPDSATVKALTDIGLADAFAGSPVQTCCRAAILGEQPAPTVRTDYLLTRGWTAAGMGALAHAPKATEDGTLLYASDHNGISAVFPLPSP